MSLEHISKLEITESVNLCAPTNFFLDVSKFLTAHSGQALNTKLILAIRSTDHFLLSKLLKHQISLFASL